MNNSDLQEYCDFAIANGVGNARVIQPQTVVTAPWVRWKCQFGCEAFGKGHKCPPDTPTPEETRQVLDSYNRAILFHTEAEPSPDIVEIRRKNREMLVDLEIKAFKDGYYKAFVMLSGNCALCPECAKLTAEYCRFPQRARPAMEACGIDVFQTARNHGLEVATLKDRKGKRNHFALLLVD
jgi:predicted metal-binding protein